jgi:hypothetical protein
MAAKYEKLDLAAFKQKLADEEYASLTGARRAVGRMTTWSEADKNKARALAEKHFEGGAQKPPKKKAAKKVAKKKAKKKVAKKKAAPKKAAKKAAAKAPKKSVKKVRRKQRKSKDVVAETTSTMDRLTETNRQIQAFGAAIDHMSKNKDLGCPSAQVQEGAKVAQQGLIAAVNNLCVLTKEVSDAAGGNGAVNTAWNTAVDATNPTMHGSPSVGATPPAEEATPEG